MIEPYDPQNIFARILRHEIPCVRIFDDDVALAFMDIMPRTKGHCLVVPKVPARNLLDVPAEALARFMPSVQRLALAAKRGLSADGVSVMQFNDEAGGQQVFHLHFHVMPRWAGVRLEPPGGRTVAASELEPIAAEIRSAL
ncbi:MAG: HIT family protein [Roseiarcus sp.]